MEENQKRYRPRKKEFEREKRKKNAQYVWDYLSIHLCIDCGETDPIVFEFDHIKDKDANIADLLKNTVSIDRINKEIEKYVVGCANCHRRKTAKDFN